MLSFTDDAQRARGRAGQWRRIGAIILAAILCAGCVALADPSPGAAATGAKVAIIVGSRGVADRRE